VDEPRLLSMVNRVDARDEPDPAFLDRLFDDVVAATDIKRASTRSSTTVIPAKPSLRLLGGKRPRWPLLLFAAMLAVGIVGALGVGAWRNLLATRLDLLTEVRIAGKVTIAVRPDHPQFSMDGQVATGFDVDFARELARRLGVTANIVVEPAASMLSAPGTGAWQLALPSLASWNVPSSAFVESRPYYQWPHFLVVPTAAPATTAAELAGPICAVSGDGGEAWLRGDYGGSPPPGASYTVVTRATDDECLSLLLSHEAVGAVTADLTGGDLQARGGVRTIAGLDPEPRVVVLQRASVNGAETASLLVAIDESIDAMRRDGTLGRLSENRFGIDLTRP